MPQRSILTPVVHRLAHYGRTLVRPGGIRYLTKRTAEEIWKLPGWFTQAVGEITQAVGEILQETQRVLRQEENSNPLLIPHLQLQKLIQTLNHQKVGAFDVTLVGEVWRYAPSPPSGTRVIQMPDPSASTGTHEFNIHIPHVENRTLVIYADIDFLFRWDRLEEDLDRFLADGRQQVIIVLIVPGFRFVDIASHSYLLSILLSSIPARKFATQLEVYVGPKAPRARERPVIRSLRLLAGNAWRTLGRLSGDIFWTGIRTPTSFSAIVISVRPQLDEGSDEARAAGDRAAQARSCQAEG